MFPFLVYLHDKKYTIYNKSLENPKQYLYALTNRKKS